MKIVQYTELVGLKKLEFDLYDEKGELLHKQGDTVTPGMILEWNTNKKPLYRVDPQYHLEDFDIEPVSKNDYIKHKPAFSEKTQEAFISNSKNLMMSIADGEPIDIKTCNETQKMLVDEVSDKIDKIKGISELRVFDKYTFSHTVNVSSMSTAIGVMLGLKEDEINELALGALLHDVGKMLVPKEILFKPGKLEPDEFEIIKTHTTKGYDYIKAKNDVPEKIAKIALEHQEKYGGTGYPDAKKANEISYYAQIVSIADVYDALVSERVYKKGLPNDEALRIMMKDGSKCFNPVILYRFIYLANNRQKVNLVSN